MQTENDDIVLENWSLTDGKYNVKLKTVDGLKGDNHVKNTLPSHPGAFILSNSERIMTNFVREINGFYNESIYYGDTDSLFIEKNIMMC